MIPNDPADIVDRERGSRNQGVCDNEVADRRFLFGGEDPQMVIAIDAPRPSIWTFLPGSGSAIECRLWNLCVAAQLVDVRMAEFDVREVAFEDQLEILSAGIAFRLTIVGF
jgi:hypothetical protein